MGACKICGRENALISAHLGVCLPCIRDRPAQALTATHLVHERTRRAHNLPLDPPGSSEGISCGICMAGCRLTAGEIGFCGLVENLGDRLIRYGGTEEKGMLSWYYDPLPTNCVAEWFCPGCMGSSYPEYSHVESGPERGYSNLAVFYAGCNHDCLFCQNWQHKTLAHRREQTASAEELASKANTKISCICFFGGDPSPQMPHALGASEIARRAALESGRILRICWETNGYMGRPFLDKAIRLSLESGGNLKFDLKSNDENLSQALCGVSNRPTLDNFEHAAKRFEERTDPPLLSASTLLVPGYVDATEVKGIAGLIASLNPLIPYTLLAFAPHHVMDDLPPTGKGQALDCLEAAKKAGARRVRIANVHLLW